MSGKTPVDEMKLEASHKGKDPKTRAVLLSLLALWLITVIVLMGVTWSAYFKKADQAENGTQLARGIAAACAIKPVDQDLKPFCPQAEQVIKEGPPGSPGDEGPKGDTGAQGPPGKSIVGAQGPRGPRGFAGKPGVNGLNGRDGIDGAPGATGATGATGDVGPPGPKGDTGLQGPQGIPGIVHFVSVGCDGPIIHSIATSYDAETQTATITCN